MKSNFKTFGLLLLSVITMSSCSKDEQQQETPIAPKPTAAQWNSIKNQALISKTQNFVITAATGNVSFTSTKGVVVTIPGNSLKKNGVAVTGQVNIEYIELFDKGSMLVTSKPTMGQMANGDKNLLKSGGEFFIKATQNGVDLTTTTNISLSIPGSLTGGTQTGMLLWTGDTSDADNLTWKVNPAVAGAIDAFNNNYLVSFGSFGWTNVDKFYSDPRPKTTILSVAPSGYDNTNSSIYLSYDGEGLNQLAKMDKFLNGVFSEHYGQVPIGLLCHIIFVTEDNGQFRYAIKGVTITANTTYTFTQSETVVGTQAQLTAAINAIQ